MDERIVKKINARDTIEKLLPHLVDATKDHALFVERLEKLKTFKKSAIFLIMTKPERAIVDKQLELLTELVLLLKQRIDLY